MICRIMSVPRLLIHTCCAPCLIAPYYQLKETGMQITGFWFNPNIHPYTEYKARFDTLREFCERESIPLIMDYGYLLDDFIRNTAGDIEARCEYCYRSRLEPAVMMAKEKGFDYYSSTLLYSRYQKHDLINSVGEELGLKYGVKWYYQDWRVLWQKGIDLSKEQGMYRQKYCGCIYSERDRYLGKPKKESI